jgi:hypothetical protein
VVPFDPEESELCVRWNCSRDQTTAASRPAPTRAKCFASKVPYFANSLLLPAIHLSPSLAGSQLVLLAMQSEFRNVTDSDASQCSALLLLARPLGRAVAGEVMAFVDRS